MRAGVNLNEVGDLKSYLNSRMNQGKQSHNAPIAAKSAIAIQKPVAPKTNTYKGLEGYVSD